MQSLAQLQPAFVQIGEFGGFDAVAIQAHPEVETVNHVHHAGNSSGIVDGAAAILIGSKRAGRRAGLEPRARIKAFANIGSEPGIMLTGPVDVTKKLLKKAGMTLADIDLIEINEAFASVVLRYMQAFDLDADGIALVTWDMPGRSMNVIDAKVGQELDAIIERVKSDAGIKGAVVTSGKDSFSAGADLSFLESLNQVFSEIAKRDGEEAAT